MGWPLIKIEVGGWLPPKSLHVGDDFLLRLHVQDVRETAAGIFQAFFDVSYDAELLLFSVPFHADSPGTLTLDGDVADRITIFFDTVSAVARSDIEFVNTSIEIVSAVSTVDVAVFPSSVPEDGAANLVYTFTRAGDTSDPLTVNFDVSGSAAHTTDYSLPVLPDSVVEGDESLEVVLSNPSAPLTLGAPTGHQVTITDDDTATIAFESADSTAIEASGGHTVGLVLNVDNGGTLGVDVTVNVLDLVGSAQTPADYTLNTTSVTFEAGSEDGDTRTADLTIAVDEVEEEDETVNLGLEIAEDGTGGQVGTGTPSSHVVTITEDPFTASISGVVWVDANGNGQLDQGEPGLPGVKITVSGEDLQGQVVRVVTWTDDEGAYRCDNLPGGTYDVTESQPSAFYDGAESLGTAGGTPNGQAEEDRFTNLVLAPAQEAADYNFGEWGLKAGYISNRMFLASSNATGEMLREMVARGADQQGNANEAEAIRQDKLVEVRQIGREVTVTGSEAEDEFRFIPARSDRAADDSQHVVEANGITWTLNAAEVDRVMLDGSGGNDEVELHDSHADDSLEAVGDIATLTYDDLRLSALAFELVRAVSESGGEDTASDEATDLVLVLQGQWDEL